VTVNSSVVRILRCWDLRVPLTYTTNKFSSKQKPTSSTTIDPTTINGSRPRGIISLTQGTGPTTGLLFALAADSRIHTYSTSPMLNPFSSHTYSHQNMQTNSFYVRVATSPCGRWLASGGAAAGSAFLYDIRNAARMSCAFEDEEHSRAVQLRGQTGEVAANEDVKSKCAKDPEESKWEYAWCVGS